MKVCPRCGRTWPDSGRFCPMDGAGLVPQAEAAPPPGPPEAPAAPAAGAAPGTAPRKGTRGTRAVRAAAPEKPTQAVPPAGEAAEGSAPRKGKPRGAFSETKWFMAGELEVPKDEIGPEILAPKDLEPRYKKTRELPPEVRRRFSLERDGEESKDPK